MCCVHTFNIRVPVPLLPPIHLYKKTHTHNMVRYHIIIQKYMLLYTYRRCHNLGQHIHMYSLRLITPPLASADQGSARQFRLAESSVPAPWFPAMNQQHNIFTSTQQQLLFD